MVGRSTHRNVFDLPTRAFNVTRIKKNRDKMHFQ